MKVATRRQARGRVHMREQMVDALRNHGADYADIRIERAERTSLSFRGAEMDSISSSRSFGGVARALVRGGWGIVTFNDVSDLRTQIREAVACARLVGKETSELAEMEPVEEVVPAPPMERDFRSVPLAEKQRTVQAYNELILKSDPKIQTSSVNYSDIHRQVHFREFRGELFRRDAAGSYRGHERGGEGRRPGAARVRRAWVSRGIRGRHGIGGTRAGGGGAGGGVAEGAEGGGRDVHRGAQSEVRRGVRARGVRAFVGIGFRVREREDARDHGARAAVRAGELEHLRGRVGAGVPGDGTSSTTRACGRGKQHADREGRAGGAAAQPGDGGEDGRAGDGERAGDLLGASADRADDEYGDCAGRRQLRGSRSRTSNWGSMRSTTSAGRR